MLRRVPSLWKSILLILMLSLTTLAVAQEAEFETNMKQARSFIKKEWYREAIKELRRAISTEQGRESFEAHLLLAQACFRNFDIGCASHYSDAARGLARAPQERETAQNMVDYLARNFAKVEFKVGPGEVAEGYLELEALDPIVDKDVKSYYREKVQVLADQRRSVPWIMYLPANTYKLYGQEFAVEGGKEISVNAGFTAENSKPRPARKPPTPRFEGKGIAMQGHVGVGVGLGGSSLNIEPVVDVSLHKTLGESLMAGAFVKLNRIGLPENGENLSAYAAPTYGVLGSYSLRLSSDLRLVPALGYAFGAGPTQTFSDCLVALDGDGQEVYSCGAGTGTGGAIVNSLVHGPILRAGVSYLKQSAKLIISGDLGVQAHYGLLSLGVPDGGTFRVDVAKGALARPLRAELLAGVTMTF